METKLLNKKLELIQWLASIEDRALIEALSDFKTNNVNGFEPFSIEELKDRIEKSLKDGENDNIISTDDLVNEISKWH